MNLEENIIDNEKIIYEEKKGREVSNSIVEYIQKEGVWALYGREKEDVEFECLNVGKCTDVGKEILYDLGCWHFVPFRNDGTKQYINQFNEECNFCYETNQVQEYLYPYLAMQYCEFKFVYVNDKSDQKVEADYANENNARFWRNGSPYGISKKPNVDRKDIQLIGECFQNGGETYTLEELLQKLVDNLGYDKMRAKRTITECEVQGYITNVGNDIYTR